MLTVNGLVNTTLSLTLDDLNAYAQHYAGWANNAGNSTFNGTGPYVLDLLNAAGVKGEATNVTFACTDPAAPYNNTVTLADLQTTYNDSIVAYDWTGIDKNGNNVTNVNQTLQLIVPAGGGKNQVKGIDLITVS